MEEEKLRFKGNENSKDTDTKDFVHVNQNQQKQKQTFGVIDRDSENEDVNETTTTNAAVASASGSTSGSGYGDDDGGDDDDDDDNIDDDDHKINREKEAVMVADIDQDISESHTLNKKVPLVASDQLEETLNIQFPSVTKVETSTKIKYYNFVMQDEDLKLRVTFFNYLILEQYELARATLRQLYRLQPSQAMRLLRYVLEEAPKQKPNFQQFSFLKSTPHLLWFCLTEYKKLFYVHLPNMNKRSQTSNLTPRNANLNTKISSESSLESLSNKMGSIVDDMMTYHYVEDPIQFELILDFTKTIFGQSLKDQLTDRDEFNVEFELQRIRDFYCHCIHTIHDGQNEQNSNSPPNSIFVQSFYQKIQSQTLSSVSEPNSNHGNKNPLPNNIQLGINSFKLLKEICLLCPDLGHAICNQLWKVSDAIMDVEEDNCLCLRDKFQGMYLDILRSTFNQKQYDFVCYFLRFLDIGNIVLDENAQIDVDEEDEEIKKAKKNVKRASDLQLELQEIMTNLAKLMMRREQQFFYHTLNKLDDSIDIPPTTPREQNSLANYSIREMIYESLISVEDNEKTILRLFCKLEDELISKQDVLQLFERCKALQNTASNQQYNKPLPYDEIFWYPYMNFIRVSNNHAFHFVLQKSLEAIKKRNYEHLSLLLGPTYFHSLKPILVLLSYEELSQDIKALQKVFDILWKNGDLAEKLSYPLQSGDPVIHHAASELNYHLKLSWWISNQVMELPTNVNNNIVRVKDIMKVIANEDAAASYHIEIPQLERIANIILRYLETNSVPYILLPWLPLIQEHEIIKLLQSHPILDVKEKYKEMFRERLSIQQLRADSEMAVICGYYAIHHFLILLIKCDQVQTVESDISSLEVQESLMKLKDNLSMICIVPYRLVVMENLFRFIFLRKEHLKYASQTKQKKHIEPFVISETLVQEMLHIFQENINSIQINDENMEQLKQMGYIDRFEKFKQYVDDSIWRLEYSQWMKSLQEKKNVLIGRRFPSDIIQLMLSSSSSFLNTALKNRNFSKARSIIQKFPSQFKERDEQEIKIAEIIDKIYHIMKNRHDNEVNINSKILEVLKGFENSYLWLDLAISLDISPETCKNILQKSKTLMLQNIREKNQEFQEGISIRNEKLEGYFDRFHVLLNISEKKSLVSTLNGIMQFEKLNVDGLRKCIKREKNRAKQLGDLYSAVNFNSEKSDLRNICDAFVDSEKENYLHLFLKHIIEAAEILHLPLNQFQVLSTGPTSTVGRLVFEDNDYLSARKLASHYGMDITKLILINCNRALDQQIVKNHNSSNPSPKPRKSNDEKTSSSTPSDIPSPNSYASSLSSSFLMSASFKQQYMKRKEEVNVAKSSENETTSTALKYLSLNVAQYLSQNSPLIASMAALVLKRRDELQPDLLEFAIEKIKNGSPQLRRWLLQRMELYRDFVDTLKKLEKQVLASPFSPTKSTFAIDGRKRNKPRKLFHSVDQNEPNDFSDDESKKMQLIDEVNADSGEDTADEGVNMSPFQESEDEAFGFLTLGEFKREQLTSEQSKILSRINIMDAVMEDDGFYFNIISKFNSVGDVHNALYYAEKGYTHGAPDILLRTFIEKTPEKHMTSMYIPRIKDCNIAVQLVFKYMEYWEIDTCIDLLHMLLSKLVISKNTQSVNNPYHNHHDKVKSKLSHLQIYKQILSSKIADTFENWSELNDMATSRPATLVSDLLKEKEYSIARKVAHIFDPENHDLYLEVEQSDIIYLLNERDQQSEALEILVSLKEDAIPVAENVIEQCKVYKHKLFVCNFILNVLKPYLSDDQVALYTFKQQGMRILCLISEEYQEKFKHLLHKPKMIVENLIIFQDMTLVTKILKQVPEVKDDEVLIYYGMKALNVNNLPLDEYEPPAVSRHVKYIFCGNDEMKDEQIRNNYTFPQAPSLLLAKAILDLCETPRKAGERLLVLCDTLSNSKSISRQKGVMLIEQIVQYAKLCFLRDPEGHVNLTVCDTIISRVELLKLIIYKNTHIEVSLNDLSDQSWAKQIRDRLIQNDHMELALNVATRCQIETDPIWIEWGLSLLRIGRYKQAREKFKYCHSLPPSQKQSLLTRILHVLEGPPSLLRMTSIIHSGSKLPNATLAPSGAQFSPSQTFSPSATPQSKKKLISTPKKQPPVSASFMASPSKSISAQQRRTGATPNLYSPGSLSVSSTDDLIDSDEETERDEDNASVNGAMKMQRAKESNKNVSSSPPNLQALKTHLDSDRLREARYYLKLFGTDMAKVSFMIRHGKIDRACFYIFEKRMSTSLFVETIVLFCYHHKNMKYLQYIIKKFDPTLSKVHSYLMAICKLLSDRHDYPLLYEMQIFMNDDVRAGLTCIRLFLQKPPADIDGRKAYLDAAKKHFVAGMMQYQRGIVRKPVLSEEELNRYLKTINLQNEVITALGPNQSDISLFDSVKRKCELTETLLCNLQIFDLAFKVMHEFRLPVVQLYLGACSRLANRKQHNEFRELLDKIKGTLLADEEWDTIVMTMFNIYMNEIKDHQIAEKLISRLSDNSKKVQACLAISKFKAAYLIAVKEDNVEDVKAIFNYTSKLDTKNARSVAELCKKYFAKKFGR